MAERTPGQPQTRKPSGATGLAIPGGLFIGIGLGIVLGNPAAGAMIGIGAGLIGTMVMRAITGDW